MARYPYALPLIPLLLVAAAPAAAEPVRPGMKVQQFHVCDSGPFKRSAWNRDFGRVSFIHMDRPGDPSPPIVDAPVRCITEKQLAKLKAKQSPSLQVIDPRDRR